MSLRELRPHDDKPIRLITLTRAATPRGQRRFIAEFGSRLSAEKTSTKAKLKSARLVTVCTTQSAQLTPPAPAASLSNPQPKEVRHVTLGTSLLHCGDH